jgi:hypothetical protein
MGFWKSGVKKRKWFTLFDESTMIDCETWKSFVLATRNSDLY